MRRLARRLFTLCSTVSLLLCVAVCVLWVRSHRVRDELAWVDRHTLPHGSLSRQTRSGIVVERGEVSVGHSSRTWDSDSMPMENEPDFSWTAEPTGGPPLTITGLSVWRRMGFAYHRDLSKMGTFYTFDSREVVFPFWGLALVLAALPVAFAGSRVRTSSRRRRSLCPSCGYDLRASPGRCPECGAAATSN